VSRGDEFTGAREGLPSARLADSVHRSTVLSSKQSSGGDRTTAIGCVTLPDCRGLVFHYESRSAFTLLDGRRFAFRSLR
jgi:hypothetical protein